MLKLLKASIVILAKAHNPSIISPDWIIKELGIKDKCTNFVHTPPFSLFESDHFLLTADTERLELICKELDKESILTCANAAAAYIGKLPHIPYKAAGMNFTWLVELDTVDSLPEIKLSIGQADIGSVFGTVNIQYGGIIKLQYDSYVLTVTANYQGDKTVTLSFNYHYDYAKNSASIDTILRSFGNLQDKSKEYTKHLITK